MFRILLIILVFLPLVLPAQFSYRMDRTIPVTDQAGNVLTNPWSGGLNAAQFNTMDLNHDSVDDLVIFDRMANKVLTFVTIDNTYRYVPEYEALFPAEVRGMLMLRDFNCDGRKDIFTGDQQGIRVYVNTSEEGGLPAWQHFKLFIQEGLPKSNVIITRGFNNNPINLQIQFDDLPAIIDADGDGDLDIFNMRFPDSHTVEYHKNLSIEDFGTCDSLVFERVTTAWGNVRECSCGVFAFNGEPCPSGGRKKHAGGKSLLALDANGDQSVDLVFSEAECTQLYLLPNDGTTETPVINTSAEFPSTAPVDFQLFPGAFYEDVDFDGIRDLVSSPNKFEKEHRDINLEQSVWFYRNTGTENSPSFSFVKNNFLQDQMIDVGDNSVPALADMDGDHDLDLFISRHTSADGTFSSVYLFENIGTPSSPEFQLNSTDYLTLSSSGLHNIKIQFADINSDKAEDLVFTATSVASGSTSLYYFTNQSSSGLDFAGQPLNQIPFALSFDENIHLTNVDNDGLIDILIGKNTGALEYWRNSGSLSFVREDGQFLGIGSSILRQNISVSTGDLDADGSDDIVLGDQGGSVTVVSNYRNQTEHTNELIFNPLTETYTDHNFGGRVWPAIGNLFGSATPAIVVGNILGGIHVLKSEEGFALFPNPVEKDITLKTEDDMVLTIYSSSGILIGGPLVIEKGTSINRVIPPMAKGFYIFRFRGQKKTFSKKIIVR